MQLQLTWSLSPKNQFSSTYHVQLHQPDNGQKILPFSHIWWKCLYIKILSNLFWINHTFSLFRKSRIHFSTFMPSSCVFRSITSSAMYSRTCTMSLKSSDHLHLNISDTIKALGTKYTKNALEEYENIHFLLAYGVKSVNCLQIYSLTDSAISPSIAPSKNVI